MEQFRYVLKKDVEVANERNGLSNVERKVTSLLSDLEQVRAQNATDKYLLKGLKTLLA